MGLEMLLLEPEIKVIGQKIEHIKLLQELVLKVFIILLELER